MEKLSRVKKYEELRKQIDLDINDDSVVVENVHLSDSLMQLSYNIARREK